MSDVLLDDTNLRSWPGTYPEGFFQDFPKVLLVNERIAHQTKPRLLPSICNCSHVSFHAR